MSQLFLRADNLADVIYDVKLFIPEWKVLFALDGTMDNSQLSEFLEVDAARVDQALQRLKELELVKVAGEQVTSSEVEGEIEEMLESETPEEEVSASEFFPEEEVKKVDEEVVESERTPESLIEEETPAEMPPEEIEEASETGLETIDLGEVAETGEEVKEEGEEDLDQLINDLLQDEEGEQKDELSVSPEIDEIEEAGKKVEAEPLIEEPPAVEEEKDDFDLGEIFETDLEQTEQSLDDMLDTIETEAVTEELGVGEAEVVPPKTEGPRKTILVVDDSVVIRKMVEIALENENYEIVSVANGKDALAFLDEKEPNMVILDIMLPDVNGLDILKAIKASKEIPVVMLSAKDTPRETSKAKELGAEDFIPKPFKDEELIGKIHELIGE